jgi:hypothetical protein
MRLLLILCMIAGLAVILGFCYRVAALALFAILSYHFLLDSSYYQSTTYLLVLLTGLLAFSPAHHLLAFDSQRIPPAQRGRSSGLFLALFRFQLAAVYFFAGIAKLDADWLAGHTLSVMVPQQRLVAMSSSLLSPHGAAVVMSWLGLWFDLLIAPGLLLRRTRTFAIGALLLFHLHNAHTFRLAHLPWGMLFLATVFLEPDWPRRLLKYTPTGSSCRLRLPPSDSALGSCRRCSLLRSPDCCTPAQVVLSRQCLLHRVRISVLLGDAQPRKVVLHPAPDRGQADRTEGADSAVARHAQHAGSTRPGRSARHLVAESAACHASAPRWTPHRGVCKIGSDAQWLSLHSVCRPRCGSQPSRLSPAGSPFLADPSAAPKEVRPYSSQSTSRRCHRLCFPLPERAGLGKYRPCHRSDSYSLFQKWRPKYSASKCEFVPFATPTCEAVWTPICSDRISVCVPGRDIIGIRGRSTGSDRLRCGKGAVAIAKQQTDHSLGSVRDRQVYLPIFVEVHVGNRPSLACQTVRGSVSSFVLTGFQRALSTILVDDAADLDELPTRDGSGLSSVSRLSVGFESDRPKARCAGLMLRREAAQIFSPSSRSRDLKPLKWMNGIGIENRS